MTLTKEKNMHKPQFRIQIGMRTIKTAVAVILSMLIVESFGTTDSRLIFAMLGATAAMQPTFRESLESCAAQIVGVLFGAAAGLFLRHMPLPMLANTGIGIVLVIILYNALHIRFSPSMPIFMVVLLCTSPEIRTSTYAIGRIWDSAIGLGVGMLINTLVFPYDNSRQIRQTVRSLDEELIRFLEDMFDGDDALPDARAMNQRIDDIYRQLHIFENQWLLWRRGGQRREIEAFSACGQKARQLCALMEVLSAVGRAGCLNEKNREKLAACGAQIRQQQTSACPMELNTVTNYHVSRILTLREELLTLLEDGDRAFERRE